MRRFRGGLWCSRASGGGRGRGLAAVESYQERDQVAGHVVERLAEMGFAVGAEKFHLLDPRSAVTITGCPVWASRNVISLWARALPAPYSPNRARAAWEPYRSG